MLLRRSHLPQCIGLLITIRFLLGYEHAEEDSPYSGSHPPSRNIASWFRDSLSLLRRDSMNDDVLCCLADELEVRVFQDWAYTGGIFGPVYENGSIHMGYSIPEEKYYLHRAIDTHTSIGPIRSTITEFDDYKSNMSYTVEHYAPNNYDNCSIDTNSGEGLDTICLPGNATLMSRGVFGDKNLPVSTYSFGGYYGGTVTLFIDDTFKPRQCRPVHFMFLDPDPVIPTVAGYNIVDLGPIKSRGIFDVPKACRNMTQPRH